MANDTTIIGEKPVAKSHAGTLASDATPQFARSENTVKARERSSISSVTPFVPALRKTRRNKKLSKKSSRAIDIRQFVIPVPLSNEKLILQDEQLDLVEAERILVEAQEKYEKIRDSILTRLLNNVPVQKGAFDLKLGVHLEVDGKKML